MDAIDEGNLELAFVACHTLIGALKPTDRDKLLREFVQPIKDELERVGNGRLDFYVGGLGTSKEQYNVLYRNIRPLYEAITETLHLGGYLEAIRKQTPTNAPMEVFAQEPQ